MATAPLDLLPEPLFSAFYALVIYADSSIAPALAEIYEAEYALYSHSVDTFVGELVSATAEGKVGCSAVQNTVLSELDASFDVLEFCAAHNIVSCHLDKIIRDVRTLFNHPIVRRTVFGHIQRLTAKEARSKLEFYCKRKSRSIVWSACCEGCSFCLGESGEIK